MAAHLLLPPLLLFLHTIGTNIIIIIIITYYRLRNLSMHA